MFLRSEDSVIQAQCNEVSEEDIHKSLNYESMSVSKLEISSDCSMQSSNGNIKNLKRYYTNISFNEKIGKRQ